MLCALKSFGCLEVDGITVVESHDSVYKQTHINCLGEKPYACEFSLMHVLNSPCVWPLMAAI